jgi:hypothetical protein
MLQKLSLIFNIIFFKRIVEKKKDIHVSDIVLEKGYALLFMYPFRSNKRNESYKLKNNGYKLSM